MVNTSPKKKAKVDIDNIKPGAFQTFSKETFLAKVRQFYPDGLRLEKPNQSNLAPSRPRAEFTLAPSIPPITRQYIGNGLLDLMKANNFAGFYWVKARQCTGKSRSAMILIRARREVGQRAFSIHSRVTTGQVFCDEVGTFYAGEKSPHDLTASQLENGAGFCMDSIAKWATPENIGMFDGCLLFLDEVVQIIAHMLFSKTILDKGRFYAVINGLRRIITRVIATGGAVIGMDADLNDLVANYLTSICETQGIPYTQHVLISNYVRGQKRKLYIYESPAHLEARLPELLEDNKAFMCSDYAGWLEKQVIKFNQEHPYRKSLLFTAKTRKQIGHPASQVGSDITSAMLNNDLFAASPALSTGVSDRSESADIIVAMQHGISCPTDIIQAIERPRYPVDCHIWVAPGVSGKPAPTNGLIANGAISAQAIKDWYFKNLERLKQFGESVKDPISGEITGDSPEFTLFCEMAAIKNHSIRNLRDDTIELAKSRGYEVIFVDGINMIEAEIKDLNAEHQTAIKSGNQQKVVTIEAKIADLTDKKAELKENFQVSKEAIKEIRDNIKLDRREKICKAMPIDATQAHKLDRQSRLTVEQHQQLERHKFESFTGVKQPTPDKLKHYDAGAFSKARTGWLLTLPLREVIAMDVERINRHGTLASENHQQVFLPHALKGIKSRLHRLLHHLEIPQFLEPDRGEIRATDDDVVQFFELVQKHTGSIEAIAGIKFDRYKTTAITMLRQLIELCGYKLKRTGRSRGKGADRNKRSGIYQVMPFDPELMPQFFAHLQEQHSKINSDKPSGILSNHLDISNRADRIPSINTHPVQFPLMADPFYAGGDVGEPQSGGIATGAIASEYSLLKARMVKFITGDVHDLSQITNDGDLAALAGIVQTRIMNLAGDADALLRKIDYHFGEVMPVGDAYDIWSRLSETAQRMILDCLGILSAGEAVPVVVSNPEPMPVVDVSSPPEPVQVVTNESKPRSPAPHLVVGGWARLIGRHRDQYSDMKDGLCQILSINGAIANVQFYSDVLKANLPSSFALYDLVPVQV
jgi:hypothetical protein